MDARRQIPQIDRLTSTLDHSGLPRPVVVDAVRRVVATSRRRARRTKTVPTEAELQAMCQAEVERIKGQRLRPVINATGVILHTNLGRAPLSRAAIDAVAEVARGYSNLEFDLDRGRRGDRFSHVEPLLAVACGAEAALVVNNNAAAVLLVCAALASGREVVISRGELIEIGGEFRIPDVLAQSGAVLREVGTTNRTHLKDYERALRENTAFILKVHPSNYRVVGFTAAPDTASLAELGVPLVYDVGSGLLDREIADEPVVGAALQAGAHLVCFSGDKLFGGPQAGIVAGRSDLVAELRTHPLLRALRPDKMQLAALGATVRSYLEGEDDVPVLRMLDVTPDEIAARARKVVRGLVDAELMPGESMTGGGSVPGEGIPTTLIALGGAKLAERLRRYDPPIVVRTEKGRVLIDLRTVDPHDDKVVAAALATLSSAR
jgi:L-seryl-tRNA(Ser) seleniumtransferase